MENFDVLILGARTAGFILAKVLGKPGRKTIVIEIKKDLLSFYFSSLESFKRLRVKYYYSSLNTESEILYSTYFSRTFNDQVAEEPKHCLCDILKIQLIQSLAETITIPCKSPPC